MSLEAAVFVSVTVAEHLIAQHSAIKMLHSRVKIILEYVKAVETGERTGRTFLIGQRVQRMSGEHLLLNEMFPPCTSLGEPPPPTDTPPKITRPL